MSWEQKVYYMNEGLSKHGEDIDYNDKYSDIIVSALAKEVVTYLGKKIGIQKKIPTTPIIAALVIQVVVLVYSFIHYMYTALPNIIISQFHVISLKVLILVSSVFVVTVVLRLLITWNNRITLSKIAYLSLLDIARYTKSRDELFERNIEDYVGVVNITQLIIGLIIYILVTASWIVLSNRTALAIALAIVNNAAIGVLSYITYVLLRKESRYSQGIVSTALRMLGGSKPRGINPYINLKAMALALVATLGLASYYMLYKIIEMYNKFNEVSNEVETNLSINLLKLV